VAGPGTGHAVIAPAAADVRSLLADPRAVHNATVFRRQAWLDADGFDESLLVLEDFDMWLRLAQRAAGAVIAAPLLIRHRRRAAAFPAETDASARASALQAIVERYAHSAEIEPADVLTAAEGRLRDLGAEYRHALEQRDRSVADIASLTDDANRILATLPPGPPDIGDLRRVTPVSRNWGYERGGPVDRHYIEEFLTAHAADVQGVVLEIQEPDYTQRFGGGRVTRSDVVDLDPANPRATVVSDLRAAANIASNTYDCVIVTQTIHVIDDMAAVVAECHRILRPGGVLLATMPAASRVCVEYGQDGDFWRVTEAGARRLFGSTFPHEHLQVESRGNVLVNAAFLYGLGMGELTPEEYAFSDPYYPALITVRATKPADWRVPGVWSPAAHIRRSAAPAPASSAGILIYHRVATPQSDVHRLAISPDEFRRQMQWVRDYCRPVSLDTLLDNLEHDAIEPGSVAITFDDGYRDNLEIASPILTELGLPATFFITTEDIDNDQPYEFWWDRLERLMLGPGACPERLAVTLSGTPREFSTATHAERLTAHWIVYEAIVGAGAEERNAVLDAIAQWRPDARMDPMNCRMSRREIATLASCPGHSIGAHTVRHLMLPARAREEIALELADNRQALQRLTASAVAHFAYPFGAFDAAAAAEVRAAGFTCGVVCGDAPIPQSADPLTLPRLDPLARGAQPFSAWLDGRVGRAHREAPPGQRRALVAGWFSYTNSDFTAGDLLACDLVCEWLADAGIAADVAVVPPAAGVALDRVDPAAYTDAIFVCGPFLPARLEAEFIARFRSCRTIGVNLSLPVPLTEWNPFAELFERNSSRAAHADIAFASHEPPVPVVGVCLVEPFDGADTRAANAAIEELLARRRAAVVAIDTRLDVNATGLRSKAEVESLLARMDAVVTTRLHGTVLALKNAVPVVVVDPEPGGSRVLRQAQAIGWPMAFAVDELNSDTLERALDYCLSPAARAKAAECRARADADVAGIRARFIAALTTWPNAVG
jgi:peptidoglycan/xylan/chitin deacetylase (PgdA/CDA1 family)